MQTLEHHNMSMRYCWQRFLTSFKCLSGTEFSETTAMTLKRHGTGVKIHLFLSSRALRVAKELQDKKQRAFYQHLLQGPKVIRKTMCTLSVVLKSEQAITRGASLFFSLQSSSATRRTPETGNTRPCRAILKSRPLFQGIWSLNTTKRI